LGAATDADGDMLTYTWEQLNVGEAGDPNNPVGNAPIFRSFPPAPTPSRTFPNITDILFNFQTRGEILPTYSRTLFFFLTVRDNHPEAGKLGNSLLSIRVSEDAGPFEVDDPDQSWMAGSVQKLTWKVANTDKEPVNVSSVKITLSTDFGSTFPIVLAEHTPNDGSHEIIMPDTIARSARIKIEAIDNIFFDISGRFVIEANPCKQAVTSFTLINAETDQEIGELKDKDTLDLSALPTARLNIRANTSPATVGSVVFTLSGQQTHTRTENTAPYTLFANRGPWTPAAGDYTLTATPYCSAQGGGEQAAALTVSFRVIKQAVTSFTLINAETDQEIRELKDKDILVVHKV
jgi:hypothetical protein